MIIINNPNNPLGKVNKFIIVISDVNKAARYRAKALAA